MKKAILPILIIFCASAGIDAQVGLNTANPAVTFDVTAKAPTGTSKTAEGLLIPRVDRERAQNMSGVPTSTLVYVNSISTGTQTGTAADIDTTGYYYYNGTVWTKLNSAAAPDVNIYAANGTLAGNRTVTQENKTLAFTGTAVNAFSVDGLTLSVDAANDRVGIGTSMPETKLDIVSSGYGWQHINGPIKLRSYVDASAGWLGTSTVHPLIFMTQDSFKAIIDVNGNMGIGNRTPAQKLHVEGAARITGSAGTATAITGRDANGDISNISLGTGLSITGGTLNVAPTGSSANIYTTDGTLAGNRSVTQADKTLAFTGTAANAFSVDGTTLSVNASNDRVGIGTITPQTKLDIVTGNTYGWQHSNGTVNLNSYVDTASGWLGTSSAHSLSFMTQNAFKMIIDVAGNVGIGTKTPQTKLDILTAGNSYGFQHSNGAINIRSYIDTTGGWLGTNTAHPLFFMTGDAFKAVIDVNGNMGIGNRTPVQKLHVEGAARITGSAGTATAITGRDANGDISNLALGAGLSISGGTLNIAPGSSANIYNTDGSLTSNRTVTQTDKTLAFTGTAVNAFSVDGNTLSVDAANNKVGIGTTTPGQALSVSDPNTGSIATASFIQPNLGTANSTYVKFGKALSMNNVGDLGFYNAGAGSTENAITLGFHANFSPVATFKASGRVGIGTTTPDPEAILTVENSATKPQTHVASFIRPATPVGGMTYLFVGKNLEERGSVGLGFHYEGDNSLDNRFEIAFRAFQPLFTLNAEGKVGIGTRTPTAKLHVIGNIIASGTITPSDIRIKKDIADNTYGLKEITKLRTITYKYKDEQLSKDKKIGFVAQEVKASMPELVTTANDEMKTLGVNYAEMTVVLTKAVQELQEIVKKQEEINIKQQEEINLLKSKIK